MTLLDIVNILAAARATLTADSGKLKVKAPRGTLTPGLKQALGSHKKAIIQLLHLTTTGWTPEAAALISWFHSSECLLAVPFPFPPGRVVDAQRFYDSLRRDIAQGLTGSRAAAVLHDLGQLHKLVEGKGVYLSSPTLREYSTRT